MGGFTQDEADSSLYRLQWIHFIKVVHFTFNIALCSTLFLYAMMSQVLEHVNNNSCKETFVMSTRLQLKVLSAGHWGHTQKVQPVQARCLSTHRQGTQVYWKNEY